LKKSAKSTEYAGVDFEWSDVVVGADSDAVEYAHKNNFHIIKNREPYHHSYEELESAWAEKSYDLYNKGLCPFTDKVEAVRVDSEQKTVKVLTKSSRYVIKYQNLHVFDTKNVSGISLAREIIHYRVLDWFDCKGLCEIGVEEITTDDEFVNKIVFFKTRRIDGDQKYLDLLCESFLTEEQLKTFDYGDTMTRFKLIDLLKMHFGREIQLSLWKRDVYPVYKCL